jgi:hypothetical protein
MVRLGGEGQEAGMEGSAGVDSADTETSNEMVSPQLEVHLKEYESIETVFERSPETHALILGKVRNLVHSTLRGWTVTEKVDGMNIRVILTFDGTQIQTQVRGRTDKAQLPAGVEAVVLLSFTPYLQLWAEKVFNDGKPKVVTVYGEAFGEGIQKNPLRLSGKRFRAFDLLIGDKQWLSDAELRAYATELNFPTVPHLGLIQGLPRNETELNAITGGQSKIATEPLLPEGIVARPLIPLFDTYGNRIIWKLTYREFDKLEAIAVEQMNKAADLHVSTPPVEDANTDEAAIQSQGVPSEVLGG